MIRVKISYAKDMNAVNHFQNIFSKLLSMYENEKQNVIDFYQKYIYNGIGLGRFAKFYLF